MINKQSPFHSAGMHLVHHVGLVVADCHANARVWEHIAGRPATQPFEGHFSNAISEGMAHSWALRFSFIRVGETLMELIQPLDEFSPHSRFLDERGEGIHHLGFRVEDIDSEATRLETLGFNRTVEYFGSDSDPQWMYLRMGAGSGSIVELMAGGGEEHRAFFLRVEEELNVLAVTSQGVKNERERTA